MVTLPRFIDNGLAAFGEWDAYVQSGSSTIVQAVEAAHGAGVGLKVVQGSMDATYLELGALNFQIPAGGDFWLSYWLRMVSYHQTTSGVLPGNVDFGGNPGDLRLYIRGDGDAVNKRKMILACYDDLGASQSTGYTVIAPPRWTHIGCHLHRAATDVSADGYIDLWVNGEKVGQKADIDNFDRTELAATFRAGDTSGIDDVELHLDEIVLSFDRPVVEGANGVAGFDAPTRRGGVRRFARHPLA